MESMKKYLLFIIILYLLLPASVFADTIGSSELIEKSKELDKQLVTYEGEVIGDIMKRGDFAWINVNDGNNAVGIWLPISEAQKIKYTGSYKYIGDSVRIEGRFYRACPEHGGELDIHCSSLEIVQSGYPKVNPLNIPKLITGIILGAGAFILLIKERIRIVKGK